MGPGCLLKIYLNNASFPWVKLPVFIEAGKNINKTPLFEYCVFFACDEAVNNFYTIFFATKHLYFMKYIFEFTCIFKTRLLYLTPYNYSM